MARSAFVQDQEEELFQEGELIDEKLKVLKRLGRGGYGEIYACKLLKTGKPVAVKVERVSKPGNLLKELSILRNLKNCHFVPVVLASGKHEDKINYICMELLGENLSVLRRRCNSHHFGLLTTLNLGMQMLRALKEVHDAGYVHRDIKPGNFVMGTERAGNARMVIMIDYGLSRKHFGADGNPKPKRKTARWVGSRRYMSLNTHLRKDQGRRDDLWSLLYVLVEFLTGTLPWAHLRGLQNLDKVRDLKLQYNQEKLVRGLPEEFLKFMTNIKTLKFDSRPDYEYLHGLFKNLYERNGGTHQTPFEWESPEDAVDSPSFLYALDDPGFADLKRGDSETDPHTASTDTSSSLSTEGEDSDKARPTNTEGASGMGNCGITGRDGEEDQENTSNKRRCVIL